MKTHPLRDYLSDISRGINQSGGNESSFNPSVDNLEKIIYHCYNTNGLDNTIEGYTEVQVYPSDDVVSVASYRNHIPELVFSNNGVLFDAYANGVVLKKNNTYHCYFIKSYETGSRTSGDLYNKIQYFETVDFSEIQSILGDPSSLPEEITNRTTTICEVHIMHREEAI